MGSLNGSRPFMSCLKRVGIPSWVCLHGRRLRWLPLSPKFRRISLIQSFPFFGSLGDPFAHIVVLEVGSCLLVREFLLVVSIVYPFIVGQLHHASSTSTTLLTLLFIHHFFIKEPQYNLMEQSIFRKKSSGAQQQTMLFYNQGRPSGEQALNQGDIQMVQEGEADADGDKGPSHLNFKVTNCMELARQVAPKLKTGCRILNDFLR